MLYCMYYYVLYFPKRLVKKRWQNLWQVPHRKFFGPRFLTPLGTNPDRYRQYSIFLQQEMILPRKEYFDWSLVVPVFPLFTVYALLRWNFFFWKWKLSELLDLMLEMKENHDGQQQQASKFEFFKQNFNVRIGNHRFDQSSNPAVFMSAGFDCNRT